MNVAVFSTKTYDQEFFDRFNETYRHSLTYFSAPLNRDTTNLTQGFDAVCAFVNDQIDRETIEKIAANGVKVIALRSAGFNNVDVDAAQQRGIKLFRVPAYSPMAVAEHAVALILTLNRKTHKAFNRIRENNFSLEKLLGFNLHGKAVGVIGTGQIGAAFCKIMLGFGCSVMAYDVFESDQLKNQGVVYAPFDTVLQSSDIVSLHCPVTPETHHLINTATIAKMQRGVMLINTSRGALIDTKDTIEALKSGQLGYLGIDVYEQEEALFFQDLSESIIQDELLTRLMAFPNVLVTAHQGFFTKEALEQIATTTLQNLTDFETGQPSKNEVRATG
ncbi:2-hydroxyacid dehydrogenase [Spirosoma soli]|uniref:2-hydroxyacid dehydrogenase n=1 Tax=Spirosoma soli TaxID=1770529 RepID=A0ABW5M160_9BACT